MGKSHLKLRSKIFILLTAVFIIVSVIGGIVFGILLPDKYFSIYPFIGILYWVMGLILAAVLDRYRVKAPHKLLSVFMLMKIIKFGCTIFFLLIYILNNPEVKVQFSIAVMCCYLIFSFIEMYIYYLNSKEITKNKG